MHSGPETFISPGGLPVNEKHQKRVCVCVSMCVLLHARLYQGYLTCADARCAVIAGDVSQLSTTSLCAFPTHCVVLCVSCRVFCVFCVYHTELWIALKWQNL